MNHSDIQRAAEKIKAAAPNAILDFYDYDFSLRVAKADRTAAFIVYQVERDDRGRPEIIGDVDAIIAALR